MKYLNDNAFNLLVSAQSSVVRYTDENESILKNLRDENLVEDCLDDCGQPAARITQNGLSYIKDVNVDTSRYRSTRRGVLIANIIGGIALLLSLIDLWLHLK